MSPPEFDCFFAHPLLAELILYPVSHAHFPPGFEWAFAGHRGGGGAGRLSHFLPDQPESQVQC